MQKTRIVGELKSPATAYRCRRQVFQKKNYLQTLSTQQNVDFVIFIYIYYIYYIYVQNILSPKLLSQQKKITCTCPLHQRAGVEDGWSFCFPSLPFPSLLLPSCRRRRGVRGPGGGRRRADANTATSLLALASSPASRWRSCASQSL